MAKKKLRPLPPLPTYDYLVTYGDEKTIVSAESDRHAWAIVNNENKRAAAPASGTVVPLSEAAAKAFRSVVTAEHGVKALKRRQKSRPEIAGKITDKEVKDAEKRAQKALAYALSLMPEEMPNVQTLEAKVSNRDPVTAE